MAHQKHLHRNPETPLWWPLQAFLEVWESVLQMAVPVDEHNGSSSPEANQRVNGLSGLALWISMDINRYQWISTDSNGYQWISMVIINQWLFYWNHWQTLWFQPLTDGWNGVLSSTYGFGWIWWCLEVGLKWSEIIPLLWSAVLDRFGSREIQSHVWIVKIGKVSLKLI